MALERGSAVHLLLERLADRPAEQREGLATRLLAHGFPDLPEGIAAAVVAEALAVFDTAFAGEIFGPNSLTEAGMVLNLPAISPTSMLGRIDRLVIGPERVLVVVFQTDAQPATAPGEIPAAYLLQLGCYRAALAELYPERLVDAAILWTVGPVLIPID
jgi:ATP-dependent helicase/nuclease subunit A